MMPDVGAFRRHHHHQNRIQPWIEVGQSSEVERKLVAENNSQDGHDCGNSGIEMDRGGAARQRSEQYLTFSQSRAHFLRQAKGRPQTTHFFIGRSALRRVGAIRSPGHRLGSPVEEPAIGVCREFVDDGEQMAGCCGGTMDFQPSRCEGRR